METTDQEIDEPFDLRRAVIDVLGIYRTEYTDLSFSKVFAEPLFWADLAGRRPIFLEGGRGTGKTMALRMLAYDGQRLLHGDDPSAWTSLGIYWRLGVNAVSAFTGTRLATEDWTRLFSHFVNLQVVDRVLRMVDWCRVELRREVIVDPEGVHLTALSLGLESVDSLPSLARGVRDRLARFEAEINGIAREVPALSLSMLGVPLKHLLEALSGDAMFAGRYLTICIDEFENLEGYQQRVFNTLLKHAGDAPYTLKIGVKPTGHRDRHTLISTESIGETADYTKIDIVEYNKARDFTKFAAHVCNERLAQLDVPVAPNRVEELLPDLSEDSEAKLLGVDHHLELLRRRLTDSNASLEELRRFDEMGRLSAYMVKYWAESRGSSEIEVLREAIGSPSKWANRLNNYSFTALFTVRSRVGPTLRKHYSGWSTYVALADGNIRYILNLVTEAVAEHIAQGNDLSTPVGPEVQTRSASGVGEKHIFDLDGEDDLGRQIMRLVLGLGRAFGVMASQPYGHAPEVTQFRVDRTGPGASEAVERLIDACVMHSGIVRFPGDKRASTSGETRVYDYQLHPILAPYFVYSYRRKRRMTVTADEVASMADPRTTSAAVERILTRQKRLVNELGPDLFSLFGDVIG